MPRRNAVVGAAASIIVGLAGCQPDSLVPDLKPWPTTTGSADGGRGPLSTAPVLRPLPLPSPSFSPLILPIPPTPPAAPAPFLRAARVLFAPRWSDTPIGKAPPGFSDPADSPARPDWLQSGSWVIAGDRTSNGVVWQANEEAPQPCLSFRVWAHAGLPDQYQMTVTVRPISSPHFKPPVGEIAMLPLYQDPTHYVEVVVAVDRLSVWAVDGGRPGSDHGWRGLKFLPIRTDVGQTRTVHMVVDRQAGSLSLDTEGKTVTITDEALRQTPTGVAIRASGNRFAVPAFRVEQMT
jgi:hypothetical protein